MQEQQGYISANATRHVAEVIGCSTADVEDVVSYYVMFFRNPVGKYVLQVCNTLSCALAGSERVIEELEEKLGIKAGETDPTGMFTIQPMECLGACDRAPVVMVNNDHWHEELKPGQTGAFVDRHQGRRRQGAAAAVISTSSTGPRASGKTRRRRRCRPKAMPDYEPVLTKYAFTPNGFTLDHYLKNQQGYEGLKKALAMTPDQVIEAVKASGLRGRGGAGFPTGLKWQFVDKKSPNPKYIVCNADESEPGTFKDHLLMERNPHLLIEGCLIGCYAIGVEGRLYLHPRRVLPHAAAARSGDRGSAARGISSARTFRARGSTARSTCTAAPAPYEAGEETALLESLEGKRAQPRFKPPFPAVAGLWACPTAVNNVETLCNVPLVMTRGAEWFAVARPREERRAEAVLRQRSRQASGRVRSADEGLAARADRRLRRRHARRAHA